MERTHRSIRLVFAFTFLLAIASSSCNCGGENNGENANNGSNNSNNSNNAADTTAPITTATPAGGEFGEPVRVELSCDDEDGDGCRATYYSVDGSTPTTESDAYDGPILIDSDTMLRFFSVDEADNREMTRSESYTIVDSTPPQVAGVQPTEDATDVDVLRSLTVTFSEPIEPATVTEETFRVSGLPGTVEYDSSMDQATFTPRFPMPANQTVEARLTTGITDRAGNPMATPFTWSFTTGTATEEVLISSETGPLHRRPEVVFDEDGFGLAVWSSDARPGRQLLHSFRDPDTGEWTAERTLAVDHDGFPAVQAGGAGFAVAWVAETADGGEAVRCRVYDEGWKDVETLRSGSALSLSTVRLASNGSGYAVSWRENPLGTPHNRAAVYDGTWSDSILLDDAVAGENNSGPTMVSDGSGYAVAWRQYDAGLDTWDVYVSIYESGSWFRESVDDPALPEFAFDPQLATNGAGYAVAFQHITTNARAIYAVVYSGGSWGPARKLSSAIPTSAERPAIAGNRGGSYVVSWPEYDSASMTRRLYATSRSASGWEPPTLLQNTGDSEYFANVVVRSVSDRLAVIWSHDESNVSRAYAAIFTPGSGGGWMGPTTLSSGSDAVAEMVLAAAEGEDEFLAVWAQGTDRSLWTSRYTVASGWSAAVSFDGARPVDLDVEHDGDDFFIGFSEDSDRSSGVYLLRDDDGVWNDPRPIVVEAHLPSAERYAFTVGSGGDVLATWSQRETGDAVIYASINEGREWSEPVEIGSGDSVLAIVPVAGPEGDFGVAFQTYTDGESRVHGAVYQDGEWTSELLDPDAGTTVPGLTIAYGGESGWVVAWGHQEATREIRAAAFDTRWGAAVTVSEPSNPAPATALATAGIADQVVVAYQHDEEVLASTWDGSDWSRFAVTSGARAAGQVTLLERGAGDLLALVWSENATGGHHIYSAMLESGTWSAPERLTDQTALVTGGYPQLVGSDDGFGAMIGQGDRLYGVVYADGAWSNAEELDDGAYLPDTPLIRPAATGYAVLWKVTVSSSDDDVLVRMFDGSTWEDRVRLDDLEGPVEAIDLAASGSRVVAIWTQTEENSPTGVYAASHEGSWTAPLRFDDATETDARTPLVFDRGFGVIGGAWRDRSPSNDPAAHLLLFAPTL